MVCFTHISSATVSLLDDTHSFFKTLFCLENPCLFLALLPWILSQVASSDRQNQALQQLKENDTLQEQEQLCRSLISCDNF